MIISRFLPPPMRLIFSSQRLYRPFVALLLLVTLALPLGGVSAQESVPEPSDPKTEIEEAKKEQLHRDLERIAETISALTDDIKRMERALRQQSGSTREEAEEELARLIQQRRELRQDLNELLSGVSEASFQFDEAEPSDFSWSEELKSLFAPLIRELKSVTEGPRELERLRSRIIGIENQRERVNEALANLEEAGQVPSSKSLKFLIEEAKELWQDRAEELQWELRVAQERLKQRQRDRKPIDEFVSDLFQLFFMSRGRNLLVAIASMILFFVLTKWLRHRIMSLNLLAQEKFKFQLRVFDVLLAVAGVLGSILVFLLVLYLFGDWLLLTIAATALIGLLWSSRQGLSHFWSQLVLLLNLGAVREGERVIVDGVPWRVESLKFYTELRNPLLSGSGLRLPIQELLDSRSRPLHEEEAWFPTKVGDWVLLDESALARVSAQTPEIVRLTLLGGATRIVATAEFFANPPQVLSSGFRAAVVFGVDYGHQQVLVTEVVPKMKEFVQEGLGKDRCNDLLKFFTVEVQDAGASALNLALLADYSGKAAYEYLRLLRLLQRLAIEACNEHGWTIPFTQVTLHGAYPPAKQAPGDSS